MLPIVEPEIIDEVMKEVLSDIHSWRKSMIHYIKDENPEINTAIIQIAQNSELDPKAVAAGAYATYMLLEKAAKSEPAIEDIAE